METRLSIERNKNGFDIYLGNLLILKHTRCLPIIEIGSGKGLFKSWHGNFRITENHRKIHKLAIIPTQEDRNTIVLNIPELFTIKLSLVSGDSSLNHLAKPIAPETGVFLHFSFVDLLQNNNRFRIRFPANPDEQIYGCGEQYSRVNLRGTKIPLWVQEQGIGRGKGLITFLANLHSHAGGHWYSTYFPLPFFLSSRGWFFSTDSTGYSIFNFTYPTFHLLEFWQIPKTIILGFPVEPNRNLPANSTIPSDSSLEALVGFSNRFLGIQPLPPSWMYDGLILGVQGGTEVVEKKVNSALNGGIKISAIWIQDWEGRRVTSFGKQLVWNWAYDPTLYPELPITIAKWRQRGIRTLGYINPFLAIEGKLYNYAKINNLCVKNSRGEDYLVTITTFPAAVLDLTNPRTRTWIKGVIQENMIGIGLAGWMADFGEFLPVDGILHSGESAEIYHNRYPVEWAKINREAILESGKENEILFFSRSGYTGASRYTPAVWAGDQLVNWSTGDGLPTAVTAGITAGLSGIGIHHSDIGGYTSLLNIRRTPELLKRWAEHSAFTQIMRTHEGNRPETNAQFNSNPEVLNHLAAMVRVYTTLKPYHQALAQVYRETGIPPIRHCHTHYPDEPNLMNLKYQYLYGPDLLVAPVVKKGVKKTRVILPGKNNTKKTMWIHLWTGQVYPPGTYKIPSPSGQPAVFFRSGSNFTQLFLSLSK